MNGKDEKNITLTKQMSQEEIHSVTGLNKNVKENKIKRWMHTVCRPPDELRHFLSTCLTTANCHTTAPYCWRNNTRVDSYLEVGIKRGEWGDSGLEKHKAKHCKWPVEK